MDVGEVADPDSTITSFFAGGRKQFDGIDFRLATVFDFPLCQALRDVVIKGASMQKIVDVLQHDELYPHPETLVTFLGNHDDRRFMSEEGSSPAKLKAAFSLLLTLRGIPQIYSGDEIAMAGGDDPDNRRDFPGGFPGDPHNAFTARRTAEQQMTTCSRCWRCARVTPLCVRESSGTSDGTTLTTRSCASRRKMKISCSSSTTTHRRRSNSLSPSKTRLSKLRTSYGQCLGTRPRSL